MGPSTVIAAPAGWIRRVWGLVRLVRPGNVAMIAAGVGLGGVLAGGMDGVQGQSGIQLLIAALSAALIGGGANSLNDAQDLDVDRLNRPKRPLPAGLIGAGTARLVWGIGSGAGVVLAFSLSSMHGALALGVLGLMVIYNVYLKRTLLVGNLVVALVTGLALVYGGWGMGRLAPVLVGAGFAFLTTLAREIVKDLDDRAGDAAVGARTLPLVYGPRAAIYGVVGVLVVTLLLTPLPFLLLDYRGLFLLLLLATDALLLHVLWILLEPEPEEQARRVSRLLKVVMIAGMVTLAFGAIVRLGE